QSKQFFIAIELIGHGAWCHLEPASEQFFVNLWNTALLLVAQCPHQRNHIQTKFPMGQRPGAFRFWSRWLVEAWTPLIAAAIDFEGQPRDALQGGHRPVAMMSHPHLTSTGAAGDLKRFKHHLPRGGWARLRSCHGAPP